MNRPTNRKGHTTMTATKTNTNTKTAKTKATATVKPVSARDTRPKATLPKVTATVVKTRSEEIEKAMNKPTSGVVVYEKEFVQEFKKHDLAVRKGFKDAGKSFFAIAFNLHWIYSHDAFKTAGKDNIYDYARDCFDLSRGTTHNYITVAERFGRKAEDADILVIRDEYAAYSPSQLGILASHTDAEIKALEITPTLSCREIKKKFVEFRAAIETEVVTENKETSSEKNKAVDNKKESSPEPSAPEPVRTVLITCKGKDDYLSHEDRVFDLIHNLLTKKPDAKIEISYYLESEE